MTTHFAELKGIFRTIAIVPLVALATSVAGCASSADDDVDEDPPPPAAFVPPELCIGPLQTNGVQSFVCRYPFNWVLDLTHSQLTTSSIGFTVQAVGGAGADGAVGGGVGGGGPGGKPGLAQATLRGDALAGQKLFIYVGDNGALGTAGGGGGAASAVSLAPMTARPTSLDDVLVVAGGGGGGQALAFDSNGNAQFDCVLDGQSDSPTQVPCYGGDGGIAIAIDEQSRYGTPSPAATAPTIDQSGSEIYNLNGGTPPSLQNGAWVLGAVPPGGSAGSTAFTWAGAPGASGPYAWLRNTATNNSVGTTVPTLGGRGNSTGGGGGGGVVGGNGGGVSGGMGGASYAVGATFRLHEETTFDVPCSTEGGGLCLKNWLPNADSDQPIVVVTIFELGSPEEPTIPADRETIDTAEPTLVFSGEGASDGLYYRLTNDEDPNLNIQLARSPTPTGNVSWTVEPGVLQSGETYDWTVTDIEGNTLQGSRSFTVSNSVSQECGLGVGWSLYVRSMDSLDPSLPDSQQPLDNQPLPVIAPPTCKDCQCFSGKIEPPPTGYIQCMHPCTNPFCGTSPPECNGCVFNVDANNPSAPAYTYLQNGAPNWTLSAGPSCPGGGDCYANAAATVGTLAFDWESINNPLLAVAPGRLVAVTSEPVAVALGDCVPSLTVPSLGGDYEGDCGTGEIEVTFASATNGAARFQVYVDDGGSGGGGGNGGTGGAGGNGAVTPTEVVNSQIPDSSCTWSTTRSSGAGQGPNELLQVSVADAEVELACQQAPTVNPGGSLCLTPETPYRVRFDGAVPYVPGPLEILFKLPGFDSFAPLPLHWVSTCELGATGQCEQDPVQASGPPFGAPTQSRALASPAIDLVNPPTLASIAPRSALSLRTPAGPKTTLDETGANGQEICSFGCLDGIETLSCTWTQNGTWELPSSVTAEGSWLVVQAVGGFGGSFVKDSPGVNTFYQGGDGGQAQAVFPGTAFAGKTLYAYVGESGTTVNVDNTDFADAGAASMVTTAEIPPSFVDGDCNSSPKELEALVIAGGGGSAGAVFATDATGDRANGGDGGVAIGRSGIQATLGSGHAASNFQVAVGNDLFIAYPGQPGLHASNPYQGTQTGVGGYSANPGRDGDLGGTAIAPGGAGIAGSGFMSPFKIWFANSAFLTLAPPPEPTAPETLPNCGGGTGFFAGSGGGGVLGGGGGTAVQNLGTGLYVASAGGAGGSSWASGAGAGVTIPSSLAGWQPVLDVSEVGQVVITVVQGACTGTCEPLEVGSTRCERCTIVGADEAYTFEGFDGKETFYIEASGSRQGDAEGQGALPGYASTAATSGNKTFNIQFQGSSIVSPLPVDSSSTTEDVWVIAGEGGADGEDSGGGPGGLAEGLEGTSVVANGVAGGNLSASYGSCGGGQGANAIGGVPGDGGAGGGQTPTSGVAGTSGVLGKGGDGGSTQGRGGSGYFGGGGGGAWLQNFDDDSGSCGGGGGGSFAAPAITSVDSSFILGSSNSVFTKQAVVITACDTGDSVPRGAFDRGLPSETEVILETDSYELRWQSDGTLATYDVTTSPATLVWSPTTSQGTEVAFQSDGNFCIDNESTPIWCTRTADAQRNGKGGETLVLWESSGNLAIYNIDSVLLWQSEQSNSASVGAGSASEPAN